MMVQVRIVSALSELWHATLDLACPLMLRTLLWVSSVPFLLQAHYYSCRSLWVEYLTDPGFQHNFVTLKLIHSSST